MNAKNGIPKSLDECLENAFCEIQSVTVPDFIVFGVMAKNVLDKHLREYFNNKLQSVHLRLTDRLDDDTENILISELRGIYG